MYIYVFFFSRLFIWKFVKLQLEIANVFDNYYWKEIFRLVFKFMYKQRTNGIDRINSNLAHVYLQGSFSFLTQHILLRPTHANRIDVIPHHYLNFYCVLKRVTRIPPRRYKITKTWKNFTTQIQNDETLENYAIIPANKYTVIELGRKSYYVERLERSDGPRWNRCCSLHGREAAPRHTRVLQRECLWTRVW